MKIIRRGKIPITTKAFFCDNCTCKFVAEKGEYTTSSQLEVMHDGLPSYKCKCPCCGIMCYTD